MPDKRHHPLRFRKFVAKSSFHLPLWRWADLILSFLDAGKDKATATRFANETKLFFEDDGSTLWITFAGVDFLWGMLEPTPPEPHPDGDGVWRKVKGGWKSSDILGERLTKDRLAGSLTKLASYRGTSCTVDVADYVIGRVNGRKRPAVEKAIHAVDEATESVVELFKLLGPKDFELLVDLVFSASGWRRLGEVGKTQKIVDFDLILPSTDERAFVQVKSRTTSRELADYVEKLAELGPYDRMFFVFHSGEAMTDDSRVVVIGPKRLAEMVVEAGLINWLIRKVS